MRPRPFTILSALSLGLCAAAFVLLHLSYDTQPAFEFPWRGEQWEVAWDRGEVWLERVLNFRDDPAVQLGWQGSLTRVM